MIAYAHIWGNDSNRFANPDQFSNHKHQYAGDTAVVVHPTTTPFWWGESNRFLNSYQFSIHKNQYTSIIALVKDLTTTPTFETDFDIFTKSCQALAAESYEKSDSSITRVESCVNATLKYAYSLEDKGQQRSASRVIMTFLDKCLSDNSLVEPDYLLSKADVEKLSSRSLLALVRTTFIARDYLPAWKAAYSRAWSRVKRLNKNPEELFVGIPQPEGA